MGVVCVCVFKVMINIFQNILQRTPKSVTVACVRTPQAHMYVHAMEVLFLILKVLGVLVSTCLFLLVKECCYFDILEGH